MLALGDVGDHVAADEEHGRHEVHPDHRHAGECEAEERRHGETHDGPQEDDEHLWAAVPGDELVETERGRAE